MRVIIQAGHEGRTIGATGAPGEQAFNIDVANKVAAQLRQSGVEVVRVTADPTAAQLAGDHDLFFAIHYDADVYGSGGGFLDRPAVDGAAEKSKAILEAIESKYFPTTGIINKPARRNKNTYNYYMWSKLSSKTPCVLIECGVGQHKPDDYDILFNGREWVISGLTSGILKGLGITESPSMPNYYPVSEPHIDLTNDASVKAAVDAWVKVATGKMIDRTEHDRLMSVQLTESMERQNSAVTEAYAKGVADGRAQVVPPTTGPVPPIDIDPMLWEQNGLTIETTEQNQKTIVNYKRKA